MIDDEYSSFGKDLFSTEFVKLKDTSKSKDISIDNKTKYICFDITAIKKRVESNIKKLNKKEENEEIQEEEKSPEKWMFLNFPLRFGNIKDRCDQYSIKHDDIKTNKIVKKQSIDINDFFEKNTEKEDLLLLGSKRKKSFSSNEQSTKTKIDKNKPLKIDNNKESKDKTYKQVWKSAIRESELNKNSKLISHLFHRYLLFS